MVATVASPPSSIHSEGFGHHDALEDGSSSQQSTTTEAAAANSIFRKIMNGMNPSSPTATGASSHSPSHDRATMAASAAAAAASTTTSTTRLDAGGPSSSSSGLTPFNVETGGEAGDVSSSSSAASSYATNNGTHPGFFSKESSKLRPRSQRQPPKEWYEYLPDFLNPKKMTRRQMVLLSIFGGIVLIVLIIIVAAAAKNSRSTGLTGGGDNGAAFTGKYRNMFAETLGKTEAEVDKKLDYVWDHLFLGDPDTEAIYVEVEPNMAQIINTESNVVTSEGISYGMISCVHMEKQEPFNRLWNWARFHMQHTAGEYESFFAWRVTRGGLLIDAKDVIPAPDAEAYIAMALIAAHRKWGSTNDYPYKAEAMRLIEAMGDYRKGFFTKDGKATFNPTDWGIKHSNPSYHLPHFWETFSRFLTNEGDARAGRFWSHAARQSRKFFHVAAHSKTGLMPDYTTIDGKKAPDPNLGGHVNFQWDAWRAPANVAVDWAWFNADGWQRKFADRILNFFLSKGPNYDSQFTVDGKVPENSTGHDIGLVSMNAVVTLATKNHKLNPSFLGELWDSGIPQGKGRYYPSMLYMMAHLHVSGRFKAYF